MNCPLGWSFSPLGPATWRWNVMSKVKGWPVFNLKKCLISVHQKEIEWNNSMYSLNQNWKYCYVYLNERRCCTQISHNVVDQSSTFLFIQGLLPEQSCLTKVVLVITVVSMTEYFQYTLNTLLKHLSGINSPRKFNKNTERLCSNCSVSKKSLNVHFLKTPSKAIKPCTAWTPYNVSFL